jgi:hypothetical protein
MHSWERVLAVRAYIILLVDWSHQVVLPLREHWNHSLVSVVNAVLLEVVVVRIMLVARLGSRNHRGIARVRRRVVVVGIEGRGD